MLLVMKRVRHLNNWHTTLHKGGVLPYNTLIHNNSSSSSGIGFPGLLTVLFIGLKLTGNITWSWVWVLSPLWISFALSLVIAAIIVIAAVISDK